MTVRRGLRVVNGFQWFEARGKECLAIRLRKEKRHRLVLGVRLIQQAVAVEINVNDVAFFAYPRSKGGEHPFSF